MRRWLVHRLKPTESASSTTMGVILFLTGIVFLTLMDAAVQWLVKDSVHVIQLLFMRSCIITLMLAAYYASQKNLSALKPVRIGAQCVRGLIGFLAPFAFFLSLKYLPLTAATVVFFSNIFIITLASSIFLKEQVGVYRWSAVAIGYVGVVIAINPNGEGELFGYLMVLLSSAAYGFLFISGKMLGATETSASLVLFYNLGVGAVAIFWLPGVWTSLSLQEWFGILLVSTLAVFGQYAMTRSYILADASLLAPLNYTSLVITIIVDWIFWHTVPGAQTIFGAAIIILSSIFVLYRQNKREQKLRAGD